MKEKAIGKIIAGLLICLMFGLVFGGLIDATCATSEKTTVSVTESSSLPDLIVEDICVYPDPPYTGGGVRVFTKIKNRGNADVIGSFSVKLYFDGTHTGEYREIDGLPAGASKSDDNPYCKGMMIVGVILWPADTNPHVVKCVIAPDNTISESNDDNNERSKSFSARYNQPPILSNGYVDPPSGDTSTVFNYYVTYKDPDGDAPYFFYFVGIEPSLYSDTSMTKISGDYKTGAVFKYSTTLPALPAGESYAYLFYFEDGRSHSAWLPPSGRYNGPTVTAIVHDMAVTDVQTSPDSPNVGQSTTIYVTVKNKGNQQEKNVPVKAYVDGSQVGSTKITLSAGKSIIKSFTWTPSTAKTYSVKGEIGVVSGETDTSDNKKTKSVSVQQPNQPPTCAIELQRQGTTTVINEINVGEFFDIHVGGSTDDQDIKEVRFSSDDSQDGNPTGTWKGWYDWDTSSGDWNAISKTKAWLFTTEGSKEVWAEVKDGDGQTRNCFANIVTENLYWLAKAILSEASVGTQEERIAVGWTVLNRLDSNEFPSTIKQVVESGYAYNQEPTQDIIDLSKDILERKYSDPTGGATHFFSPRSMGSGYGPYKIPGTDKSAYIPDWAIPKGYGKESPPPGDWEMTEFYQTIDNTEWVSGLNNVRNWYFMFYRSISSPSVAKPAITTPLEITPIKDTYYVADNLNAKFTIKNIGDAPITFDKLLAGGRFNGGKLPNGEFPDFTFRSTTLQPNVPYQYAGTLTLTQSGNYHFFIAYYIENPTPEEKKLLDENNWNTCVDLGKGLTDEDRIEAIEVLSLPEVPYIDNEFWVEVSNPAGAYICNDSVDFTFGRNRKRGDRGDDVEYLQIVLNANPATQVAVEGPGSPCHETNYFGELTEAAIIKFQTLHEGLTQTGELDEATRAELNKLYLPVKHVPNEWVLNVTNTYQNEEIQDGCVWWEVKDVTDGIKGWVAYQRISDEAKYLEVGDQEELKNRINKLNMKDERIPVILQEVSEHRTEFLPDNFPQGIILAMAIQESGGEGFDNEIVALTPWGRGIMQIDTDNYVGAGSGIRWYNNGAIDYCRGKEGHGCTCSAGICYCEACKHYYTNTIQGIEANIKDGLYVLGDKYNCQCCYDRSKDAEWDEEEGLYRDEMGEEVIFYSREEECKGSDGQTYDSRIEKIKIGNVQISCTEFKVIDAVWRYNGRSIYPEGSCRGNDYLRCVADKLNEIERTFGYEMPDKDTWIESLKAVSRSASVMKKIK